MCPRPRPQPGGLTPREREVMALVAQGFSNRDIAEALVLSELTVKTHLKHIFKKLDVRSRQEAVAVAARRMAGG